MNLAEKLDPTWVHEVMEEAQDFLKSYGLTPSLRIDYGGKSGLQEIANSLKSLPEDKLERNDHLNIELRTNLIRNVIEAVGSSILGPVRETALVNMYGTLAFKCPKPRCNFFATGFETKIERNKHSDRYDLPVRCPNEGCFAFRLGFESQSRINQHMKNHHSEPGSTLQFPIIAGHMKRVAKMETSLCIAAEKGDINGVKILLDAGECPIQHFSLTNPITPLYLAAGVENFNVCKLLVEKGASIDTRYSS